jgi:hypothetical protein
MSDAASRELLVVLVTMGVLFVFGVTAIVIFIRTWRKEHRLTSRASSTNASRDSER